MGNGPKSLTNKNIKSYGEYKSEEDIFVKSPNNCMTMLTDIVVVDFEILKQKTGKLFFQNEFLEQPFEELEENKKSSEEENNINGESERESQRTTIPIRENKSSGNTVL